MAAFMKLSATFCRQTQTPGRYGDGACLYFEILTSGKKGWLYRLTGTWRKIGDYPAMSLSAARELRDDLRQSLRMGERPFALRQRQDRMMRFKAAVEGYIKNQKAKWKSPKTQGVWRHRLTAYADPILGDMRVDDIEARHILEVLQPIWHTKTTTAGDLRSKIECVLDYAFFLVGIEKPNPARWKGGLAHALPSPKATKPVKHFPAMPYKKVPDFYRLLQTKTEDPAAQALCLLILTASRSAPIRLARWEQFDLETGIWTVPADNMKGRKGNSKDFRVPLTDEMVEVIEGARRWKSEWVFPSRGKPLSTNGMAYYLKGTGFTVHGFRSSFRDWAGETNQDTIAAEMVLAHTVGNDVERSYARSDLLERKRGMLSSWNLYSTTFKH